MQMSESIKEIAGALKKIQAQLPAVGKDSKGYGYEYASLPEVCNKVYPLMAKEGLSVSQVLDNEGGPAITTMLMHESGEWISGTYPLHEAGMKGVNSAQQFGAAITYARRYGLLALIGVPVADDDAACLSEQKQQAPKTIPFDGDKVINMIAATDIETGCRLWRQNIGDLSSEHLESATVELLSKCEDAKEVGWLFKAILKEAQKAGYEKDLISLCAERKEKLTGGV